VAAIFLGAANVGGCASTTVTSNAQVRSLADESTKWQVTCVVPLGNLKPLEGEQPGFRGAGQLSLAVVLNVTTAEH
jgi:hypothetical protein